MQLTSMLLNIFETNDENIDYRRIEELFAWLNGRGMLHACISSLVDKCYDKC